MKKLKTYIIPVLILGIFIAIMNSGRLLKKPFSNKDDVYTCIAALQKNILSEDWAKAQVSLKNLKTAWKTVEKRVQFSVERNDLNTIDDNIARIEGSLLVQDKTSAIIELSEIKKNWSELEK